MEYSRSSGGERLSNTHIALAILVHLLFTLSRETDRWTAWNFRPLRTLIIDASFRDEDMVIVSVPLKHGEVSPLDTSTRSILTH